MQVVVGKAKGDTTIIKFGANLRADPRASYIVYHLEGFTDRATDPSARKPKEAARGWVPTSGRVKLSGLRLGEPYLVLAKGATKAGSVATERHVLRHPFLLTIDANRIAKVPALAKPRPTALAAATRMAIKP